MNELDKENKYCVYMHINKINNKFYVGITSRKAEQRWGSNGSNYSAQAHFWYAIQKYGWDNFDHIVLLDKLTKEEACKIEVLLIALLNTQDPNYGYNTSAGGDGGTFGLSMSDDVKNKISESLKGRKAWNKGIKMPPRKLASDTDRKNMSNERRIKKGPRAKKVIQYDMYGNFIKIWDSITEASMSLNTHHSCISDCCRGSKKQQEGSYGNILMEREMTVLKVLAFDQSTKISAYSEFIDGEYVECNYIDLHKMKDTSERVRAMGVELCNVIEKYNPDKVVLEEVAQQSNPMTLKLLARIQGVIIGFCAAHNIDTYIIEPSKWRSTLNFKQGAGVKREELKLQAIQHIKNNYDLDLSEDECEACCINEAAHKIYNFIEDDLWD